MTERQVAELGPGTACCGWNHCGRRLAAGAADGSVSVYDSQPSPSFKWQVSSASLLRLSPLNPKPPHEDDLPPSQTVASARVLVW